jgi:hypothetical protein
MTNEITRRKFVQVTGRSAFGTIALSGLSWAVLSAEPSPQEFKPQRQPLVVKPILAYDIPSRRDQPHKFAVLFLFRLRQIFVWNNARMDFLPDDSIQCKIDFFFQADHEKLYFLPILVSGKNAYNQRMPESQDQYKV